MDFPSVTFDGTFLHGGQHETQMAFVKVKLLLHHAKLENHVWSWCCSFLALKIDQIWVWRPFLFIFGVLISKHFREASKYRGKFMAFQVKETLHKVHQAATKYGKDF